jgi:hypothetical protein
VPAAGRNAIASVAERRVAINVARRYEAVIQPPENLFRTEFGEYSADAGKCGRGETDNFCGASGEVQIMRPHQAVRRKSNGGGVMFVFGLFFVAAS